MICSSFRCYVKMPYNPDVYSVFKLTLLLCYFRQKLLQYMRCFVLTLANRYEGQVVRYMTMSDIDTCKQYRTYNQKSCLDTLNLPESWPLIVN